MSAGLLDLAAGWLRVGLFGFGGGPSVIPLIRAEAVERYHWLSDQELLDAVAFGNSLPGPIAVKLAAFIGHREAGWLGAAVAIGAMSLPGIGMMIGLGAVYARFREHAVVVGMMSGVRPAVVALLAYTVWTLGPDGVKDTRGLVLAGVAFVALVARIHPAVVVGVAALAGVFWSRG